MAEIAIPIEEVANPFFLTANSFVVTGPTLDLSIQVVFCQDVLKHRIMNLVGEPGRPPTSAQFDAYPCRLALGTVALPLDRAKELVSLLQAHIEKTEEAISQASRDQK